MKLKLFAFFVTFQLFLIFIFFINITQKVLYPIMFENEISDVSCKYCVSKELIYSIINAESSFNVNAKSEKGALGLMQILPTTAVYIAKKISYQNEIDLFNASCNIELGTAYLSYLQNIFQNLDFVICAYNAGEGNVKRWISDGRIDIRFEETRNYLKRVKLNLNFYSKKIA